MAIPPSDGADGESPRAADSSPIQITYVFLEDETDHLVILDDASVQAALNRLGSGGWQADPMEAETGDVPAHLMISCERFGPMCGRTVPGGAATG